jgi:RimJ/RimL family protein N-acetyltransferase
MLDHLRTDLDIASFGARVDTRNARSRRLAERLRFVVPEAVEGADEFKGSVSDEHVHAWRAGETIQS